MFHLVSTRTPRSFFFFFAKLLSPAIHSANLVGPQHVLEREIVPLQVKDFALQFVELCKVPACPLLQPVQVPLDSSTTLWFTGQSSQLLSSANLLREHSAPLSSS